jgi:hypothetical protein
MMMGPRQIAGRAPLHQKADRHELDAVRASGWMRPCSMAGLSNTPNMRGMLGP